MYVTYEEPLAGRTFTKKQMMEIYRDMACKLVFPDFECWFADMLKSGVFEKVKQRSRENNYFKEVLTMPKMKYCYVNIKNEVVSPFFNTKKEAINYLDNGGKIDDSWMFSLEYVRVWSK